jgi:hypothetical protein
VEGEIRRAVKRLEERKRASSIARRSFRTVEEIESAMASARALYVGTDLDFTEASEAATDAAEIFVSGILAGYPVRALAAGNFAEGLLVGLLVAEAREREAARS